MKNPLLKNNSNITVDTEVFYRRAKVLTPAVWVFVAVLIAFLAGLLIFCFQGNLKSCVYVVAEVFDGETTLYVPDTDIDRVLIGQQVEYEGSSNVDIIRSCDSTPVPIRDTDTLNTAFSSNGNYSDAEAVYKCTARTDLENGAYEARIVVAEMTPIEAFFK